MTSSTPNATDPPATYSVFAYPTLPSLIEAVNEAAGDGWRPLGGVGYDPVTGLFLQAATRSPA